MPHPYVVVAVPVPARKEFTYRLSDQSADSVLVGRRVVVPFGSRHLTGVVVGTTDKPPDARIKEIHEFLDESPIVTSEMLKLTKWASDYYLSSWGEILRAALPVGWNRRSRRYAFPAGDGEPPDGDSLDDRIVQMVIESGRLPVTTLAKRTGESSRLETALRRLTRAGRIVVRALLEDTPGGAVSETWVEILPEGCVDGVEGTLRKNAVRQIACLLHLRTIRRARRSDLRSRFGNAPDALEKKGMVRTFLEERTRIAHGELEERGEVDPELTGEQEKALDPILLAIQERRFEARLLHGVTSSGKTEVYIRAAAAARSVGRSVLVLVPEIALTPQTVGRFRARFGKEAVVLHSGLTPAERHDTWREIHRGRYPVVVGVRSAIFAPLSDIGLIVVDEEHDGSYKQGESPRYHARDLAVVRARLAHAPVILGSATPSIESYYNARTGKYEKSELRKRIENRPLPRVKLIDLRKEPYDDRVGALTLPLVDRIRAALSKKNQVMIFLNRRGFSPFLHCSDCGYVPRCSHCDVAYTYHRMEPILRCHYCGTEQVPPAECPECEGNRISHRGIGTQRVEEDLARAVPGARIARMDLDTTRRRDSAREILQLFASGQIDILLGTQMIAKGHHFPGVSLVGVVNADTALHLPDFRAGERSFQLLIQVSGRAGRGESPGEVVLQSFAPDHYCVRYAAVHDYESFVERELADRRELKYPPFARIISILFRARQDGRARIAARRFREMVRRDPTCRPLYWEILGPTPAPIPKGGS